MNTITKAKYLEILLSQIERLRKEGTSPDDLKTLEGAFMDTKELDFKEVEVIQSGNQFAFQPILENEND
ncbi:hypothetical protein HJ122_23270 [Vibrio parahaemolyticus]|nr:hypothetical protein [Vibrio parahaemolyticus]